MPPQISAQIVTPATGGMSISADAFATGTFIPLTGPVIQETAPGQLTSGKIRLIAPTGFKWDTGGTAPSITVTSPKKQAITASLISRSAAEIVFQISGNSVGPPKNNPHRLEFQGLRIGLSQGIPLVSDEIRNVGSAAPGGQTNYGNLSVVAGADAKIRVSTTPNRAGSLVTAREIEAGNLLTVYANVFDQFNNFKRNVAADWSLSNVTGLSGNELSSTTGASTTFNATKTGSANIRADYNGLTAITSGTITVTPAKATSMAITTQPSSTAIAGQPFSRQPVIKLFDTFGNVVTDNSFTRITATRNVGVGDLQGTTSQPFTNGVAAFTNLSHNIANNINISFSAAGLPGVTSNTISVDHAPAEDLIFTVQPPNGARSTALEPAPEVQIVDKFGNEVDLPNVPITLEISSATSSQPNISGNSALSNPSGVATFPALTLNKNGAYTLKAGTANLDSSKVSDEFIIADAGTLTDFVIEAEGGSAIDDPTPPEAGTSFNIKITAVGGEGNVLDGSGNQALFESKVSISSSGNLLTGAGSTANFVNGVLSSHTVNISTAGEITISATGPENAITGTSEPFTVLPAAANADSSFFTASALALVADGSSRSVITVTLIDKFGNNLISGGDDVQILSSGPGTLSTTTDNGDGTYSATLTAPTGKGSTTITATVNGNPINDKNGNPQQITIDYGAGKLAKFRIEDAGTSSGLISEQTAGVSFNIKITALDAFGNIVTSFDGSKMLGATVQISSDQNISSGGGTSAKFSNGVLASHPITITSADSSAIIKVRATGSSQTGSSNSFIVNPGPASPATSIIMPGRTYLENDGTDNTSISVQLRDEFNNPLTTGGDNITLSTTAGSLSSTTGTSTGGIFSSTLTAGTASETAIITATVNGQSLTDNASVTITQFNKWTGSAGGRPDNAFDWSNTANWSLSTLPTTGQVVLIPGGLGTYPTIDAEDTVNPIDFLIIEEDATITLSNQLMTINKEISGEGSIFAENGNFTIKGNVDLENFIAGSSVITFAGNSEQTVDGDLTAGTLNIQNDVTVNGYFEAFDTLTISADQTLRMEKGSQLVVIGDIIINGSLIGNSSNFRFGGDINGTNITVTNTDIELDGTSHQNIRGITSAKNLIINNAAGVTVHNNFTVTDTLTLTSGLLTIASGYSFVANIKEGNTGNIEMLREISGQAGYRMIAPPLASTYADFLDSTITQGYTGATLSDTLQPNVLYYDESYPGTENQRWRPPTDASNEVTPGRGLFVYFFGDVTGDDRYNNALPDTLSIQGEEFDGDGTSFTFPVTYTADADTGWNLVGNPFAATIDWDDGNWTKENMDNCIYVWDPATNDYLTWNGISGSLGNGLIMPFQAFWVKANGNGTPKLKVKKSSKTTGGTFKGKEDREPAAIEFLLEAGELDKTTHITFSPKGETGKDRRDAFLLLPFNTGSYLELYTTFKDGTPLAINNLARDFGKKITIPIHVGGFKKGHPLNGTYTLSWPQFSNIPNAWTLTLVDQKTDKKIDLRKKTFYSFDVSQAKQKKSVVNTLDDFQLVAGSVESKKKAGSSNPRFLLYIDPGADAKGLPSKYSLGINYPNPFQESTTIKFATPVEGRVQIFIYDILGRRVKTIVNKNLPAAYHEVHWNPTQLASGIYIYVMRAGGKQFAKKMTYIK